MKIYVVADWGHDGIEGLIAAFSTREKAIDFANNEDESPELIEVELDP